MKNKIMIKIITLILIMLIIFTFSSHISFAGEVIKEIDRNSGYEDSDLNDVKDIAGNILTAVRNVSIIAAVIAITVIGVKYMVGSAEERAGYKKSLIPLAVGIIIVAGAASIIKAFYNLAS